MGKKEPIPVCSKCGSKSFMNTSEGIMCKECKHLVSTFAPLPKEEKK